MLFDNNLSHKLVARLIDIFPDSSHVMFEDMDESEDDEIWSFSMEQNFTIITKDADYNEMNFLYGFPPKIVWVRVGNCKLADMERIIRRNSIAINEFFHNKELGVIEIS
ncbi:MAG: hypothetical protein GQ569_09195 [Methylococcaceae bacterium]|nr:hypothetical protein [Methylococcaceae bacterium]